MLYINQRKRCKEFAVMSAVGEQSAHSIEMLSMMAFNSEIVLFSSQPDGGSNVS